MYIVVLIVFGLVGLGVFVLVGKIVDKDHGVGRWAYFFIWAWLIASVLNGAVGVFRAGIPLLNEIGAFIPIFGVPAAVAFYAWRRFGSAAS